jgi:dUTP pyrophosphatase
MNLKVYRTRKGAKLPTRAYQSDAGMDVYYCANGERKRFPDDQGLVIAPRESTLVPTGIKVDVPYGHMLEVKNKSGIASKRQLIVGACVIDPGYNGEVYINVHNIGLRPQTLFPGDKVAQVVLIPIVHCKVEEVETEKEFNHYSGRGTGGFGSTGDK